jgi:hypothetical protein
LHFGAQPTNDSEEAAVELLSSAAEDALQQIFFLLVWLGMMLCSSQGKHNTLQHQRRAMTSLLIHVHHKVVKRELINFI